MKSQTVAKGAIAVFVALSIFKYVRHSPPPDTNGGIPLQLFSKSTTGEITPTLQYSHDNFCRWCPPPIVYDDASALAFIRRHPLEFIPDAVRKWNEFPNNWNGGVGRSEFFRFYYLFVAGGIYLDHDAVIATDARDLVHGHDLVVVNAWLPPGSSPYIMAGFIAARPRNELIKQALQLLYETTSVVLEKNYLFTCQNLHRLYFDDAFLKTRLSSRLLEEIYEHGRSFSGTTIVSEGRHCAGRHMFRVGDNGGMDDMNTMLKWMDLTPSCIK